MLLSRKHKFIFIHIYKNAGTSIYSALLPFASTSTRTRLNVLLKKYGVSYFDPQPFRDHITAPELVKELSDKTFRSFFSFAIVRNPWDWQVSQYTYMLQNTQHFQHELVKGFKSFDEYIEWRCAEDLRLQKDFVYSQDGRQLVSYIGRYENLQHDFSYICSCIGISAALPRLNVSGTRPYWEYYSKRSANLVREHFAPDIEMLGYDFQAR